MAVLSGAALGGILGLLLAVPVAATVKIIATYLFGKLNELQSEVDRERTRFDAFAALAIEAGGVVGDVVEKSNILKLLDSIAKVFWGSKKEEETKRLPAPTPPKRLEPPRAPASKPAPRKGDLDDEIPF